MVQELVLPGSNRRLWIESEEEGKLASMAVVQESDMVHEVYRAWPLIHFTTGWMTDAGRAV